MSVLPIGIAQRLAAVGLIVFGAAFNVEPVVVAAQARPTLSGRVVDSTSGGLPGVTIIITPLTNGEPLTTVTDAAGRFTVAALTTGQSVSMRSWLALHPRGSNAWTCQRPMAR